MTALPEPNPDRILELDGIRGLAILLVLVWHYVVCPGRGAPPLFFRFLLQTWSGVDLFFVLSGFLIGGILLDHRDSPNYFSVFYRRRVARIFPIYFAWLLLFVLLNAVQARLPLGSASAWLFAQPLPLWSYATFTQNFLQAKHATFGPNWLAVTWSLAVEEQFYLLLPLVIRFVPVHRLPYVLAPFIVAAPVVRTILYNPTADVASYVLLICKTDALLLGVLCAWFARLPRARERISAAAPLLRIALLSGIGFACVSAYVRDETVTTRVLTDSLLAGAYASLILLAVYVPASPVGRMARTKWLRKLGIIAYGTYLLHQAISGIVFGIARKHWPYFVTSSDLLLTLTALTATLTIASLSWHWFEKPIVDISRRWSYVEPPRVTIPDVLSTEPSR